MAEITQNNIRFSNVYKDGGILHGDTIKQDSYNPNAATPSEDNFPLVNCVDIDWNGADITSTVFPAMDRTINTTGDSLSWIKEGIEEAAVSGRISEVVRLSLWINLLNSQKLAKKNRRKETI